MKIEIEWLTDCYDACETCGSSYAEGAKVYVDGALTIDMSPSAHCFGGANYYQSDVYDAILKWLGHEVAERCDPITSDVGGSGKP
jgi:hypothetical protein